MNFTERLRVINDIFDKYKTDYPKFGKRLNGTPIQNDISVRIANSLGNDIESIDILKLTYRKHVLNDDSIGWNELSDKLCDAICNIWGIENFNKWIEEHENLS